MKRALIAAFLLICASVANAASCPKGYRVNWNNGQSICEPFLLPENARLNTSGDGFDCNRGFRKNGYGSSATCDSVVIPENARLNAYGNGFDCNRGFYKKGYGSNGTCERVVIPENARLDASGDGFDCNRGFRKNGYGSNATCDKVVIPAHAKLNYGGDGWTCERGFVQRTNTCIHASHANDEEIRQLVIDENIGGYPGNCPCPYFTDRAGRRCGGRSAYSRPGGYSPLCYPSDVNQEMVESYRRRFK